MHSGIWGKFYSSLPFVKTELLHYMLVIVDSILWHLTKVQVLGPVIASFSLWLHVFPCGAAFGGCYLSIWECLLEQRSTDNALVLEASQKIEYVRQDYELPCLRLERPVKHRSMIHFVWLLLFFFKPSPPCVPNNKKTIDNNSSFFCPLGFYRSFSKKAFGHMRLFNLLSSCGWY